MTNNEIGSIAEHIIAHLAMGLSVTMPGVTVSATEPTGPDEPHFWYKPPTGGAGGVWYARAQKPDESWTWVYLNAGV